MEGIVKPWHGIQREEIRWNPEVDEELCIGCGMCVTGCGRRVYRFDFEKKKPIVAAPLNCMVACVTCANTCLKDAISFPPVEDVRELIQKEKLLAKAMKELKERMEELKTGQ
ncbi:MAG: 4Fe-4S binding protein [Nitrospiraceae bacterium]|nr:4Fe-4S binding protein [Nitrospiraceae bacterium]